MDGRLDQVALIATDGDAGTVAHLSGLRSVLWLILAGGAVGLFLASLPAHYAGLRAFSGGIPSHPNDVRSGLAALGLSADLWAAWALAAKTLMAAGFVVVGCLIFWRRHDSWSGWLFALALVTFGAIFPNTFGDLAARYPALAPATRLYEYAGYWSFFVALFYIFPDGRFVPRRLRPLVVAVLFAELPHELLPGSVGDVLRFTTLDAFARLSLILVGVFAQVYRYRRVSSRGERRQTRGVLFALAVAVAALLAFVLPGGLLPGFIGDGVPWLLYDLLSTTALTLAFLLVPLAIGAAILRYRLWDIDLVINRTLVYLALTACVAGLYILLVGLVGGLGVHVRDSGDLILSLGATTVVALLFQPLRERLQRGVNRLLYAHVTSPTP